MRTKNTIISQTERRRSVRHAMVQPAEMHFGSFQSIGELLEISNHGARVLLSHGFAPMDGSRLDLSLLDGTSIGALVRWSRNQCFGVSFDVPFLDARDHLHYDHMGYKIYPRLIRFQRLGRSPGR